jgi:hypothetical protein
MSTETQTPTWMFTFAASKLKIKQMSSGSSNYRFKVKKKHVSEISLFSERPDRLTSKVSAEQFKDTFNDIFKSDKPNASMAYWRKGYHSSSFEMKTFRDSRNNSNYIIDANLLDSNHGLSTRTDLENVSLFVDSAWLCPAEEFVSGGLVCIY